MKIFLLINFLEFFPQIPFYTLFQRYTQVIYIRSYIRCGNHLLLLSTTQTNSVVIMVCNYLVTLFNLDAIRIPRLQLGRKIHFLYKIEFRYKPNIYFFLKKKRIPLFHTYLPNTYVTLRNVGQNFFVHWHHQKMSLPLEFAKVHGIFQH